MTRLISSARPVQLLVTPTTPTVQEVDQTLQGLLMIPGVQENFGAIRRYCLALLGNGFTGYPGYLDEATALLARHLPREIVDSFAVRSAISAIRLSSPRT
ncbi:MAG: hypothetical protein WKF57_05990 [Nakamurella sp.]